MDRYDLMDERELLQMQEEEKRKNALLEMMRMGVPGKRLPMIPTTRKPWTLMDHLRQAYEGIANEPKGIPYPNAVRG